MPAARTAGGRPAALDAELTLSRFKRLGYRVESRRVWSEEPFAQALAAFAPELIISDHFDARLRRPASPRPASRAGWRPPVPFIFISGTLDPARAQEARANGAADYLSKNDLSLLGPVLERALAAAPPPGA